MGILHAVPAGLPTGTVANKVAGDDWRGQHVHVPFDVTLLVATTANLTPAPISAAVGIELFASLRHTRRVMDLSTATQARLIAVVIATGNATGGAYKLMYTTIPMAAGWSGADMGPSVVLGTDGGVSGTLHAGAWTNLAAGAQIDDCYFAAVVGVALGTTAPTIGALSVQFR